MAFTFTVLMLIVLVSFIYAAIESDRVTSMPGLKGGVDALPSTHYSGYLPVGELSGTAGHMHYWFIESSSPTASTDPVILWLNGGPGSSSLIGLLTENGQIQLNDDSLTELVDGYPQVFINEYAWSTKANMLYLESPKGVGFSYCDDVTSSKQCVNTDESTALDGYEFLVNFFAAYPEYKANKFYMTGESYAGIYLPMLMDQVSQDVLGAKINAIGLAAGNGCIGNEVGTCAFSSPESNQISAQFYFGHGMYSQQLREEMLSNCGDFTRLSPRCIESLVKMETQLGDFDVYDIYDECGSDERRRTSEKVSFQEVRAAMSAKVHEVSFEDSMKKSGGLTQALGDYQCGSMTAMDVWLANPDVMAALHVTAPRFGMTYQKTVANLLPLYSDLIEKYQVLIYSGDVDGCVPYVGTENWTRGLNFTVTNDWHQWFALPDDVHASHKAGYAVTFDKFQFITINGAGHLVPQTQPSFALTMLTNFINNVQF